MIGWAMKVSQVQMIGCAAAGADQYRHELGSVTAGDSGPQGPWYVQTRAPGHVSEC